MRRRPIEQVQAWLVLLPALARLLVRRVRRFRIGRGGSAEAVRRPIVVGGRDVGTLTVNDDAGTSTAETMASLVEPIDLESAAELIGTVTAAAFGRGNHRAAWTVCSDEAVLLEALSATGFRLEGQAAGPLGDTRAWQIWSRLSTDAPVTRDPRPA